MAFWFSEFHNVINSIIPFPTGLLENGSLALYIISYHMYHIYHIYMYNLKIIKNYHIHLLVTLSLPSGFRAGVKRIFVDDILYSYNDKNKMGSYRR